MEQSSIQDKQDWIEAFHRGDNNALSYFFKLNAKSLSYFAVRLIHDELEAEDIIADCFVKVWERRADFKTEDHLKAFLYTSCRNACLDYLRHLKVKSSVQQKYYNELVHSEETILYQIVKSEVLRVLNEEIEHLPENYREVFKLIYFDYKKTDEIAAQLGLSIQTVRNYKTRAVELLKTSMLKKGMSAVIMLALLLLMDGK